MKLLVLFITFIILIKFNYAFYDRFVLDRFGLKEYVLDMSNVDINKNKSCDTNAKKCIWKCCPEGQILGRFKECVTLDKGSNINNTLNNITVYNEKCIATNKSMESIFKLVPGLMKDEVFAKNALWWYQAYLVENGKLFVKFPNVWNIWKEIDTNHFCIDLKKNDRVITQVFMTEYEIEHFRIPSPYKKWALVIFILCLFVTLVVYLIVPQLKDRNGILFIMFFCCLIMSQIMHCCLESYNTMNLWMSQILTMSFIHYFFKVSSFCWTNIMFYRVLKSRYQSEDEEESWLKELLRYCPHAFGTPLFLTIVVATIELSDMTDMPNFVTPQIQNKGNFSFHEIESLYYLYIPLMIILTFNWIVCFLKVVEFCKTSRQFSMVSGNGTKEDLSLNRPMQFVKILAVISIYALLEMFTVIYPIGTHYTSSTYTLCIGPIIMIILITNKTVKRLLMEQIKAYKEKATTNSFSMVTFFQRK